MGSKRTGWQAVVGLIALAAQLAVAEEGATRPALIGAHEQSLAAQIEFPKVKEDVKVAIRCQVKIDEEGGIETNACFNGDPEYQYAILKASRKSSLKPALLAGEPVSVYVLYTVLFVRQGEAQDVMLIPNHSINGKLYGLNYLSPQRLVTTIEGQSACADMTYFNTISGVVGLDGAIQEPELGLDLESCPECIECIQEMAGNARYIPGYTKEGLTAMKFAEPVYKLVSKPDWFWRRSRRESVGNVPMEGAGAKIPPSGFEGGMP